MDFIDLNTIPHYSECEPLVRSMGYVLVDLKIIPQKTTVKISAVIASQDSTKTIGVEDCSKVHHALLPRLEALLGTDDTYMELTSPGTDRNIKNAAEFALFKGTEIRVWDKNISDWVSGIIEEADSKSVTLNCEGERKSYKYEDIAKAKFLRS
ncbi:MAG: ribosome maturation factor RimP [Clostridiales bacterium]|nr:ribosome maturation factor RimP [Clostridiales bacterium]